MDYKNLGEVVGKRPAVLISPSAEDGVLVASNHDGTQAIMDAARLISRFPRPIDIDSLTDETGGLMLDGDGFTAYRDSAGINAIFGSLVEYTPATTEQPA